MFCLRYGTRGGFPRKRHYDELVARVCATPQVLSTMSAAAFPESCGSRQRAQTHVVTGEQDLGLMISTMSPVCR